MSAVSDRKGHPTPAAGTEGAVAGVGTTIVIGLPWETPPLNLNNRWPNEIVKAKAVAEVRESAGWVAKGARLGTYGRVRVTLHYRPLQRRRRDEDNLVATLKPCCDGLVDAKLVKDDTPEYMVKMMPVIHKPDGIRRNLWLTIDILEGAA